MILIFVNPFSGSGKTRQRVDDTAACLRDKYQLETVVVDSLEERRKQLADPTLAQRCSCLVVAGGDGTVAAVINETHLDARSKIPLAIIPVGNENLLARELKILKASPQQLAAAIAKNKTKLIDIGVATGNEPDSQPRIFTLMASAGLDSDVVCRVEAWRKLPKGLRRATRLSYLKPMLAGVLGYHFKPLKLIAQNDTGQPDTNEPASNEPVTSESVTSKPATSQPASSAFATSESATAECATADAATNGSVTIHGYHAFIFNINRYGGGLGFCPKACCDDGQLDYIILTKPGRLHALRYLTLVALGWHTNKKDITIGRAKSIRLESNDPLPIQADGDTIGQTAMTFKVIPNAVNLIMPV